MSKLALLGGRPVTKDLLAKSSLVRRGDLEREYLLEAYDSGIWDDWPHNTQSQAAKFAREWARFQNAKHCVLLTNGTHTLQVALEALDIGAGDEVLVPGVTWQATAATVVDVNAVPVFVDVDPTTMCIDVEKAEAAVTPRTRAIMPVHLYHRMADMDRIKRLAKKHSLFIIEDAAHAHGSRWGKSGSGTLGDFGSFSFQSFKLITGAEGGALLTQNEELFHKANSQRICGRDSGGFRVHNGNYRITSFSAAVLRGQLAAFRKNAPLIDRRGRALDKAVDAAPGTKALRRHRMITRQCSYQFAFLYDKQAFDGVSGDTFRKALSAELGVLFHACQAPLSHSSVYYPHTKKRHQWSKSYLKAITPSRWDLPVADELWKDSSVLTGWRILGCTADAPKKLTEAIGRLHDNREQLLDYDKQAQQA